VQYPLTERELFARGQQRSEYHAEVLWENEDPLLKIEDRR
jgi:hypothetical protein